MIFFDVVWGGFCGERYYFVLSVNFLDPFGFSRTHPIVFLHTLSRTPDNQDEKCDERHMTNSWSVHSCTVRVQVAEAAAAVRNSIEWRSRMLHSVVRRNRG